MTVPVALSGELLAEPHHVVKALRFGLDGYHGARRGVYRVIYRIRDEEVMAEVVKISHRADAYV